MATKKTATKRTTSTAGKKKATTKAVPGAALVLKRETVTDLQAMLKQATKVRQSRKVCIA